MRPHVLGIDDGPFAVGRDPDTPIVAVMTEGPAPVEAVAVTRFPIDGDEVTSFLADWIRTLRLHPALQAIVVGGITIAGLGVVDLPLLAQATGVPVVAVSRRDPRDHRLGAALRAAGRDERLAIVARTPAPFAAPSGLYLATAGTTAEHAARLVEACRGKAHVPEPLRLAHMIARAVARGESRGRV